MIRLHPIPDAEHNCPRCQVTLQVRGWYIPGMRNLADLRCPRCGTEYYGDLPAGHGLYYPMLLEQATGLVHDEHRIDWFANWLRDSYGNRVDSPVGFSVETFRPLRRVLLLNCLDVLYGHCLLKLLNAQYYVDHCQDLDLVVLIPRFLRWMVPDGTAAIWTVDLPLSRGIEWNDWLAAELKRQIGSLKNCWLSLALSHPHPVDYNIERFTRVRPFPDDEWDERLKRPTVTFVWREDRVWQNAGWNRPLQKLAERLSRPFGSTEVLLDEQRQQVVALARALRRVFPQLDFGVAGVGHSGGLPAWMADLRSLVIDESVERGWCERYAKSQVVVGVHGSNMLLPSAHAGAVVELVPVERWANLIQDILVAGHDSREALYRYRFLPLDTSSMLIAQVVQSLLHSFQGAMLNFGRRWCDHNVLQSDSCLIVKRRREMTRKLADL